MSCKKLVLACLICTAAGLTIVASAPTQQEVTISKNSLQQMYTGYLIQEGFRPEIDGDGDIRFKCEGKIYHIIISEKDPKYFRMAILIAWPMENEKERQAVLAAANHANSLTKVAKIYWESDILWIAIEGFLHAPEDFKPTFKRSVGALQAGSANFAKKMRD